jgi:hypothetical protein
MGALLHILAADQSRLDTGNPARVEAAYLGHGQDTRVARLMADNAEQREQIEALRDANYALSRRVADLTRDLATATGANAQPQEGARIVEVPIPNGKLLVEVETEGGDDGIDLLNVFVGGKWIGVEDLHAATDLDVLRESVAEVLS